jgi:methionyl-tRNA formyltransferase
MVFFGTPDFAGTCLNGLLAADGIEVAAVVSAPDKPGRRGSQLQASPVAAMARDRGLLLLQPERLRDEGFIAALRTINADLFMVVAFRMLPEVVWSMPRYGSLNIHGSLLPDLRGAAPIQWSIALGDRLTGLTAFSLNHAIDEGDILAQIEVKIGPNETFSSLYDRMAAQGTKLAVSVLQQLGKAEHPRIIQDREAKHRSAPKIGPEFAKLESLETAKMLHDRIRACDSVPGASLPSPLNPAERFKLFSSHWHSVGLCISPTNVHYIIDNESIKIVDLDGYADILEVQWPGKRRMQTSEFLRGSLLRGSFALNGQKFE